MLVADYFFLFSIFFYMWRFLEKSSKILLDSIVFFCLHILKFEPEFLKSAVIPEHEGSR